MSGNLGAPLGAVRAGGYDAAAPAVDPLGLPSSGLLVEAALGTIPLSSLVIDSLTIVERMGTPDTASLVLSDVDGSLDIAALTGIGYYAGLCDLHIASPSGHLFRGQVVTAEVESVDGTARTVTISSAEGYERLIAGTPVAYPPPIIYDTQPDGTQIGTYKMTTNGQSDKGDVGSLFAVYWVGPPVDADTKVEELSPGRHPVAPLDRVMLDAALGIVADVTGTPDRLVWWLDAALRFHWTDGADPGRLDPAPYAIDTGGFAPGVVMPLKITTTTEAGGIVGGLVVDGALPWGCDFQTFRQWAPWAVIGTSLAQNSLEVAYYTARYRYNNLWPKVSGRATVTSALPGIVGAPAGEGEWHKGQWVVVTDRASGLLDYGCLVQAVTRRLVSAAGGQPEFEYDIEYGDAPRRSIALESAAGAKAAATTATSYTVTTDDTSPTPSKPANVKAQLCDFAGVPLSTAGIAGSWSLDINGTRVADPIDTSQAFWLDTATGTTDGTGRVFNVLHVGASATAEDYADPFFETVEP